VSIADQHFELELRHSWCSQLAELGLFEQELAEQELAEQELVELGLAERYCSLQGNLKYLELFPLLCSVPVGRSFWLCLQQMALAKPSNIRASKSSLTCIFHLS
jgi:hypothetical protein